MNNYTTIQDLTYRGDKYVRVTDIIRWLQKDMIDSIKNDNSKAVEIYDAILTELERTL